ncbi:MAG TPA: DUF456 domain-containing protein [Desulfuromonadaceae bacterium]|nr:DUF456 domain-containing protein [Desulfuromonadaceae bacterium]
MTTEQIIGLSLALLIMVAGLIGSILPVLPGTPLILVTAIAHRLYFGQASISNLTVTVLVVLTVVSIVFDLLAGALGAKKFGSTWRGALGAIIGGLVGLFLGPIGILVGPFLGAMLFEIVGGKKYKEAANAGLGAMIGLILGIVGKFSIGVLMILSFTVNVIVRST